MNIPQVEWDAVPFAEKIAPAPLLGGFAMEDYWVWCGSAIQGEDGLYHLFASRWPKAYPMFFGYILHSEIVHAVADTPAGPYRFVEKVLPTDCPERWDGRMAHNPTIRKWGDTYLLYYIGSTYGRDDVAGEDSKELCDESYANIRIGVAASKSVYGPWQTFDHPVLDTRAGKWDASIVTNPAPVIHEDGSVLLYYRSNTPEGLRIGIASAPHYSGPYTRVADEPIHISDNGDFIEDPFVWRSGGLYHMLAKDMLGGLCGEVHAGVHFHSENGVEWERAEHPRAYSRKVRYDDGETRNLGCLERPQLLFNAEGQPTHLFAAAADGPGGFFHATKTWNIAIPLRAGSEAL